MITFTVPEKLRRFIRSHQRLCYAAMFKASSETIKKLAADQKYIGGDLARFFRRAAHLGTSIAVSSTHPLYRPRRRLSRKDDKWHCSRIDFFLPVKAMSKIFKAKFRDEMKKAGLLSSIAADVWKRLEC